MTETNTKVKIWAQLKFLLGIWKYCFLMFNYIFVLWILKRLIAITHPHSAAFREEHVAQLPREDRQVGVFIELAADVADC